MNVRMKFACFMLMFGMGSNGCSLFVPPMPPGARVVWSKKGLDDEGVRRFYLKCYPRINEMYKSSDRNLFAKLEIEGQTCMLENGFYFKDAHYPYEKLCSRHSAKSLGLASYMDFPACQSKYGKYRK